MPKQKEEKELTDGERLQSGQLYVRVIIEFLGKPKDYVEKLMNDFIKGLKKDDKFEVTFEEFSETKEIKSLFGRFVELELWVKKINYLVELCIDYMPSSIEIIEPEAFRFKSNDFAGYLNDLQARLHQLDMIAKNLRQENQNLRGNSTQLLKNLVLAILKAGNKTLRQLSNEMGIAEKDLPQFLAPLEKANFIKKKGELYTLK